MEAARAKPPPEAPPPTQVALTMQPEDFAGLALFPVSQGQVPSLAPTFNGHFLARLNIFPGPAPHVPDVAEKALSLQVRGRHRKRLLDLQVFLNQNPDFIKRPLADGAIRFLLERAAKPPRGNPWLPGSTFREATSLTGALSNLDLYSTSAHRVLLSLSSQWKAALAGWKLAAHQSKPINQCAATLIDMEEAIDTEREPQVRALLMLLWLTAARPGDLLQLRVRDLEMEPNGRIQAMIRHGKAVKLRSVYTVKSSAEESPWREELSQFIARRTASADPDDLLFPGTNDMPKKMLMPAMLAAVRRSRADFIEPEYTLTAVRRGSLQCMAAAGVELETLRGFSGHSSIEMLLHYLDYGKKAGVLSDRAAAAARPLAGKRA